MPHKISVLIAVRNESRHIADTLESLKNQDYPIDLLEIIVIDGCSTDNTIELAEKYKNYFTSFSVVSNAKRLSACGWNLGIKLATGDVISILSGHAILPQNYYSCLMPYLTPDMAGVGGRAVPCGYDKRSKIISAAFQSRLGNGGATYISGKKNGFSETISFGCYWKTKLLEIGGFDEEIVRGQDWDLNLRLNESGKSLFFVADVEVEFLTRNNFTSLWKRQFSSGLWKFYINKKSKKYNLIRHYIPALFALFLSFLFIISLVSPAFLFVSFVFVIFYLLVIVIENKKQKIELRDYPAMVAVYFIIHYAYGLGFLVGLLKLRLLGQKKAKKNS